MAMTFSTRANREHCISITTQQRKNQRRRLKKRAFRIRNAPSWALACSSTGIRIVADACLDCDQPNFIDSLETSMKCAFSMRQLFDRAHS
jgi:hypothetical protein